MHRQDDAQLHMSPIPEDGEYSLESILAEYGKGGRQPAQTQPPPAAPVPEPAPSAQDPVPPPQPEEITTRLPKTEKKAKTRKWREKRQDTAEFPVIRTAAAEKPAKPPPPPEPEEELPPDRVSLKHVMHDTVDAVLAENDDGILEPPLTLKERLQLSLIHI